MMQNLSDKFVLAIAAALGVSLVTVAQRPGQAATVTYNFDLDVTDGILAGKQGTGFFTYDDSTLTGKGEAFLAKEQGLSLQLDFLGTNYTEADDVNDNDDPTDTGPLVNFSNGKLLGLNLSLLKSEEGPLILIRDRSLDIPNYSGSQPIGYGTVSYSKPVPEPSSILGISALGMVWLLAKLRRQKAGGGRRNPHK